MYKQLTDPQRYLISVFLKSGMSQRLMGEHLGVHPSTISRELRRNRGKRGYRPKQAHAKAMQRRYKPRNTKRIVEGLEKMIVARLKRHHSPEQISGRLRRKYFISISHETIYQYIARDASQGGSLYKYLRRSSRKRKKRYSSTDRRGQIKNRVFIDQRPKRVLKRKEIGHWEGDTMLGARHKGALATLVERRSLYVCAYALEHKSASETQNAITTMLKPHHKNVSTLTVDNGKEFANHEAISKALKADVYFTHPYASWEKPSIENMNGLLRQYYPKSKPLTNICQKALNKVCWELNNRPRKSLGYRTPYEVLFNTVALDV